MENERAIEAAERSRARASGEKSAAKKSLRIALAVVIAVSAFALIALAICDIANPSARLALCAACAMAAAAGLAGLGFGALRRLRGVGSRKQTVDGESFMAPLRAGRFPRKPLHTLAAVSYPAPNSAAAGRFTPPGEVVLHSGRAGDPITSVPSVAESADPSLLRARVDRVLFDRLDEVIALRPGDGCILLVAESAAGSGGILNGAAAALCLARAIASTGDRPTLLIDAGSPAWSTSLSLAGAPAPDILALPGVAGVFDIIERDLDADAWTVLEDDLPSLTALAPGQIPDDWQERLMSDRARSLLTRARRLADVTIVYGPPVSVYRDVARALAESANGVLLVSGSGESAEAADLRAAQALRASGVVVMGRIALVGEADSARVTSSSPVDESARTSRAR